MGSFKLEKNTSAKKQATQAGVILLVLGLPAALLVDVFIGFILGLAGLVAIVAGLFASE